MQGARAALLGAVGGVGAEAEQLEHGRHADGGPHGGEVDAGTLSDSAMTLRLRLPLLVLSLAKFFAAFTSLDQLAIPRGEDFGVTSFEPILGRDVVDGAVQADIVVQLSNTKPTIPISGVSPIPGTRGSISGWSFMNP